MIAGRPPIARSALRQAAESLPGPTDAPGDPAAVAALVGLFLLGLVGIHLGRSRYRTNADVAGTETDAIGDVTPGRTAIAGTVRPAGEPLEQPFTGGGCVYYRYEISELVEKEGLPRPPSRRERRGERAETEWRTRARGARAIPFYVEDDTGAALVEADSGASFSIAPENVETSSERYDGPELGGSVEPGSEGPHRRPREREYSQSFLPPGADVFVVGGARDPSDTDDPAAVVIGEDRETGDFVVSERGTEDLARGRSRRGPLLTLGGAALSALALYLLVVDVVLA